MTDITNSVQLREEILLLEIKQAEEEVLLKQQFNLTYESLKPVNILKDAIREFTSPVLKSNVADMAIGITTGYVAKRVLTGAFHNPFIKLLGAILQVGVTNIVTKHPGTVKSGLHILKSVFAGRKRE